MTKFLVFTSIIRNIFQCEYLFDIGHCDFLHPKTMDKF
jgi:hypothetical protein